MEGETHGILLLWFKFYYFENPGFEKYKRAWKNKIQRPPIRVDLLIAFRLLQSVNESANVSANESVNESVNVCVGHEYLIGNVIERVLFSLLSVNVLSTFA